MPGQWIGLDRGSTRWLARLFGFGLLWGIFEICCWLIGSHLRGRGLFYEPPRIEDYRGYLERRDPLLGWPAPQHAADEAAVGIAPRFSPAFPESRQTACVSVYGDSFAYGAGVEHAGAWPNRLAEAIGCRVDNRGVPAYGTDQAFLGYLRDRSDRAPVKVLCHTSLDIIRNVSQYLAFFLPRAELAFKPRFLLNERGSLDLVPIPSLAEEQIETALSRPSAYFPADFFVPGGEAGVTLLRFPYSVSMLKLYRHFMVQARLQGKLYYEDFYRADHHSRGLQATSGILSAFHEEGMHRGERPLIVLFPTCRDLARFPKKGTWVYQPLIEDLRARGIEPLNIGDEAIASHGTEAYRRLFDTCQSHPNELGNLLAAQAIERWLVARGLDRPGLQRIVGEEVSSPADADRSDAGPVPSSEGVRGGRR